MAPVPRALLYPDTEPFRRHRLAVGDGHVLHVQEHGRPDGLPALVLHGGPGSGCTPLQRRFFDPARYRIICVDQRGAGLSTPRGGVSHNTTAHLVADLRALRHQLGVSRWLVVGGSWGAALALAYASTEPDAVAGLLLRASFLARSEDIAWFFQGAAAEQPAAWQALAAEAPADRREALLPFLAGEWDRASPPRLRALAPAWARWEQALAHGEAAAGSLALSDAQLDALVDRYRIQCHYLQHGCWLQAPTLLERCEAVPRAPTLLLHGRRDQVCRPEGALALHRHLPHARLRWVDDAGHDPTHPAMVTAMVEALDCFAAHGGFTP